LEDASRRPDGDPHKDRRGADRTSAPDRQAREGLRQMRCTGDKATEERPEAMHSAGLFLADLQKYASFG